MRGKKPAEKANHYVVCEDHPGLLEPGYMMCEHVQTLDDVYLHEPPSITMVGVICCQKCYDLRDKGDTTVVNRCFFTVCAQGLRDAGLIPTVN